MQGCVFQLLDVLQYVHEITGYQRTALSVVENNGGSSGKGVADELI